MMLDKIYNWITSTAENNLFQSRDKEFIDKLDLSKCKFTSDNYPLIGDWNRDFVYSLDKRQAEYYFSLSKSWRMSMTDLEERVYQLEQNKVNKIIRKKNNENDI